MVDSEDLHQYLTDSLQRLTALMQQPGIVPLVEDAILTITAAIRAGKPILTCGNGGSASDAMHISGELVGRFNLDREALNVVCLNSNVAVITAWGNDVSFNSIFSRQVQAHGAEGGVLLGLSTSGNSTNVVEAFRMARNLGMSTILMTGSAPGALGSLADTILSVPAVDAPSAQNLHVVLYHFICAEVERRVAQLV